MDELPLGTIRVKHKLIPQVPFIIINESDFDSELHTLYEPPGTLPEPEPPIAPLVEDAPTSRKAKT